MTFRTNLRVIVRDGYAAADPIIAEFSDTYDALRFGTRLHGGFGTCIVSVQSSLPEVWEWLQRENSVGKHFAHVTILEESTTIYEGRVMFPYFDPATLVLTLEVAGYWSSTRDDLYTNAAVTNGWTAKNLIEDMVTNTCPDLSTDFAAVEDPGVSLSDGTLAITRAHPQDVIVDSIPHTSDGTDQWFVAVWADRVVTYKARSVSAVTWTTQRSELAPGGRIGQSAYELRNHVIPVVGGSAQTAINDSATRPTRYPKRAIALAMDAGTPTGAGSAAVYAGDRLLAERKDPRQTNSFIIDGKVYGTAKNGERIEAPLWRVRAGDVLRIDDLLPLSVASPALDNLRTFFVVETDYDAARNVLRITPDRPENRLSGALPRIGTVEPVL